MQTQTPVEARISNLEKRIEAIGKYLPFADGQAYYDDLKSIQTLQSDLTYWKRMKRLDEMDKISSRFDDDFKKVFA